MSEASFLKALVLEDEWPTRNYLVKLIEDTHRAEVIGAVATLEEAREAMKGSPMDVVFVDVQLTATGDSRTGLDLIRSMAREPSAPMFVLATASSQHSLEAFDLGVVDYILKPYTEERVEQCLKRLLERRASRSQGPRRVVARRKKSLVFLDPDTIWAFEAADRLTFVHAPEGRFDIDLSLAAIESSFGRSWSSRPPKASTAYRASRTGPRPRCRPSTRHAVWWSWCSASRTASGPCRWIAPR